MFCSNCGYDLIGIQGSFCPNCDTAMQAMPQYYNSQADAPSNTVKIVCIALLAIIIGAGGIFAFHAFNSLDGVEIIEFGGIEWRVLDRQEDGILVISEYILERRAYHAQQESVTWADSSIRRYLNGEFLNRFTPEERRRIIETKVINDDNPWFDTNGGQDTTDYVFLLSLDEVLRYFGDSGQLGNQNHPDNLSWGVRDRYNDNRITHMPDGTASWWWLRSPGKYSVGAAGVTDDGDLGVTGLIVVAFFGGLRPALWLRP